MCYLHLSMCQITNIDLGVESYTNVRFADIIESFYTQHNVQFIYIVIFGFVQDNDRISYIHQFDFHTLHLCFTNITRSD